MHLAGCWGNYYFKCSVHVSDGFPKKNGWGVGGLGELQVFFGFLEFLTLQSFLCQCSSNNYAYYMVKVGCVSMPLWALHRCVSCKLSKVRASQQISGENKPSDYSEFFHASVI